MADRKGATGEKSYRSRNRAISALVQSSKNVVVTDLSIDSANVSQVIDSDYILAKKFVQGDAERRLNITTAAPTGAQQVSTGDLWLDRNGLILYRLTADGNWSSSLPAGSFSAEAGLTSHNVFEANAGADTGSFNIGASHTPSGPSGSFSSTFRISTSPYNSGGRWTFTNPVNFSYYYIGNSDAGHLWSIGYTDGSYMVANSGLAGSKTVTPSSYTWYDAGGNSLGKTINQSNSGAHTHDVRHPNGVLATYIIHGRNNYGTRSYDAWLYFSGANQWQRVGEIYDSSDIKNFTLDSALTTQLIDSAYITARASGTDSAAVISLIDSAYVTARAGSGVDSASTIALINSRITDSAVSTAFTYTYTATASQTVFSGNDNNSNFLRYNAGSIQAFQNGVLLVDTVDYTATSGTSLTLNSGATVGDVITITKFSGLAPSGTLSHTQFKFISATPTTTFSGPDVNSRTLSYQSGEIQVYLNGLLLVDSDDYVAANGTSVVLTSATDSGDVVNISKFVQGDGGMAFRSTNFVYTTGSPTTTIAGSDDNNLTLSYINDQIQVFRNGILLIDSADYTATNGTSVILNQATNAADTVAITAFRGVLTGGLDSGNITNLVDASYVQARQSAPGLDSSKTTNLIDSSYVQARQTTGGGGVDSATVISLSTTNSATSSTFRDSSANPILSIEAGTRLQHSGWTDSAGTNSPPFVNAAQIRKGGLVQVSSNITGSQGTQAFRERQQFMYQNCFYLAPSANTGIDILRYTMLDNADNAVPSNNEVYGRVNWICWGGGHTNATGNGSNHTIGTIDYNGASPSNGTAHQHADGNAPTFAWNHSNFVSTLNVQGSGNSANVGYFTIFVQILFTHGAGPRGAHIYYKLEELV